MMKLQTPVLCEPSPFRLSYADRIMVLGSCFADEIGQRLVDYGFQATFNPFGTLYNPVSISNAVARLASRMPFTTDDVVEMGAGAGKVCSFSHHTSFARTDPPSFLENANARLAEAAEVWKEADRVLITLGTAWAFRWKETGETVANCLKRPAAEFTRYRLTVPQVSTLLSGLTARYPDKQFLFTVSPIRHLADGAHGNQLSKSTLLLGIEQTGALYFPAFEIVMDELRDYRFYAEDMVHPSRQTAGYLWERFIDWALPEEERPRYEAAVKAFRQSQHRPLA